MKKSISLLFILLIFLFTSCQIQPIEQPTTTQQDIYYTDTNGKLIPALSGVQQSNYNADLFITDENLRMTYADPDIATKTGIDVSQFQGNVDWQAVKNDGIDFVMLRVGCRGYGPNGLMLDDDLFSDNYYGAKNAGLQIGVYFFSQAITAQEALEEADYVLNKISGLDITYPVAYDWEHIDYDTARTDNMTGEEITACANAFCEAITKAGYTPLVYFNCELGYFHYDFSNLTQADFWLAEYAEKPSFYYHYTMWQYTKTGRVDGIDGDVDINISMRDYSQKTVG